MKKILVLMLGVLSITQSESHPLYNSAFTLSMFNQSKFYVRFDDVYYPAQHSQFSLGSIRPGKHFVEVIRYRKNHYNQGYEQVIVSSRWINIPADSKVSAIMDKDFRIRIQEITGNCSAFNPGSFTEDCNSIRPMNPAAFAELKRVIENASFESSRMTIARQAISNNHLLARQVEELLNLLWFESSRLELAKFAYMNTLDKENYFRVNNTFRYDSSISELNEYINHS